LKLGVFLPAALFGALTVTASQDPAAARTTVLLVVGAAGEADFGSNFLHQTTLWQNACLQARAKAVTIGTDAEQTNDLVALKQAFENEPKQSDLPLWLVFIGHGTFDGKEAKFNLRGPDLSATELSSIAQSFRRPLAIINTSSASAPFLNKLSSSNRVIITATRSGNEQNYCRFGQYFADAIAQQIVTSPSGQPNLEDPGTSADLDKDGQVSLLEAFLWAARQTAEFYKLDGRLATEHSLLDDNGDGLGTPADWFQGLRPTKQPKKDSPGGTNTIHLVDGVLAHQFHLAVSDADARLTPAQRAQRDALERAVLLHRERKSKMPEDEYYKELEKLLLELARLYETVESLNR